MSLIGFDGFDHYDTKLDFLTRQGHLTWAAGFAGPDGFTTSTRFGIGKAIQLGFETFMYGNTYVNIATGFIGCAVLAAQTIGGHFTMEFIDSVHGAVHGTAGFDIGSGAALIGDATGTIVTTGAAGAIPGLTWGYFEAQFKVGHAGVGQVIIRWNGNIVAQNSAADFWSTSGGGTQNFNQFSVRVQGAGASATVDDLYVNDSNTDAGTFPNNGFNGDVTVTPLYAIANNAVTWTPLSGTNWQEISEVTFDGDATYNTTATAGNKDMFAFASVPAFVSGVIAVQLVGAFKEDSTGSRTVSQHLNSSGTDVAGASRTLNTGYSYWSDFWTLDPSTSASWTVTAVNNLLAGYNLDT